jgi:hypothetical protein
MPPLHRTAHRLVPVLSLTAGLILGAGIGIPTAHWVAGFLTRVPAVGGPPGSAVQPSSTALPLPSITSSPAPATAVPTPTPSQAACSPLATGQQPLDPLRQPPSGYTADTALDWVGCGAATLPATDGFTVAGPWLVALSYTCPTGTAPASGGTTTLTVSETSSLADVGPQAIVAGRSDSADVTDGGPDGSALGAGAYHLNVVGPLACIWHLAVYRG